MDITNYPDPSREEYLREIFSIEQQFEHHGSVFYYVPSDVESDYMMGQVGRMVVMDENLSPADRFKESKYETHKACVIVIDPTEHQDGKKYLLKLTSK